ncbi:MAG: nucleotidyl transferase AbiEii/AbiGii toxin family protein [Bacteroidales bacterium]|nr:nucleotidyl transferase AbiEii/AbiGii toxin family protein [Bacteroidales bacterium]
MNNYHSQSKEVQRFILEQTALKQGVSKQIVEKDLWVSVLLEVIFTLPFADKLVFKGGTSLSKVWGVIDRFSEDIDLAFDRSLFGYEGDLTVRQLKKLRKTSSLFVCNEFCEELLAAIEQHGLGASLTIEAQPDGTGDRTYPEPRQIFITYNSLFNNKLPYIKPRIILEVGARSLFEPTQKACIDSMVTTAFPDIQTSLVKTELTTAVAAKTFLEKAFLLHELFTTDACSKAERKSRHLYDLERMMDKEFAISAIKNHALWNTIHHHREIFTRLHNVDYTPDIRSRIALVPPAEHYQLWANDYADMQAGMIYGDSIPFDKLIERMKELEQRFRSLNDSTSPALCSSDRPRQ